jgi:hypothetical protein
MLEFSPLFSLSVIQAIAHYISSTFSTTTYYCSRRSNFASIAPPLTLCSARFGALYHSIMIHHWFIVGRLLGLYWDPFPLWRPRKRNSSKSVSNPIKRRTPPAPNYLGLKFILLIYMFLVCAHVRAVFHETIPIHSLCATPMIVICSSSILSIHQYRKNQTINNLLTSSMNDSSSAIPTISTSFYNTTCNATKLAMLSAWQTTNERFSSIMDYAPGSKPICIDTGASSCISNDKRDFLSLKHVSNQTISGIGSGLNVEGRGTLRWTITDNDGNKIMLHVADALYVPNIPICLLCPQQVAKQTKNPQDGFLAGGSFGTLIYDGFIRTVPYNGRNGLPLIFAADPHFNSSRRPCDNPHTAAYLSTATTAVPSSNLSKAQRKLLHVHERMAHLGFDELQLLARQGHFGDSLRCIGSCDKPLCHACCLGKAQKRPVSTTTTPLKATHLVPGACVSTDQLESNTPGKIAVLKGRPSKDSYHACTFFIDHASNKVHISLHQSTGVNEALAAKHRFEKLANENNVTIKEYHGDNGVYASAQFKSSCELSHQ